MGSRNNNAFVGTQKGLGRDDDDDEDEYCDDHVGLGLRILQQQVGESCPNNNSCCFMPMPMPMPMPLSHHHHLSPSSTSASASASASSCCCSTDGFDGGASCGGAIVCNSSNQQQVPCTGDIYDVVGAASASASASAAAAVVLKSLHHPFTAADLSLPHNSSGEMAATNGRVAFTTAQWQELERQTTIYKYMMASIPVPPELLIPLTRNPSNVMKGSSLELGFSSNSSDPEPWRCRRTDGKKWRCSRDVAPDQKYCERHSHKSRPRSRKPVELPNHPPSINNNNNNDHKSNSHALLNNMASTDHSSTTKQQQQQQQPPPRQSPHFLNHSDAHLFTISPFDQSRCLEWFMKGEATTTITATIPFGSNSNPVPDWQQQFKTQGTKYGDNVNVSQHHHHHRLNLQAHHHLNQQFMIPNLSSLGGDLSLNQAHNSQQTRSFIDAWSSAERSEVAEMDGMGSKRPPLCSNDKLPISSLTLSMSGGNIGSNQDEGDDHESSQMGAFGLRPQIANPISWMGSPPGGPLAEALCLGIASSQSTSASSYSKST